MRVSKQRLLLTPLLVLVLVLAVALVQVFLGESPTSPDWCSTDGHIVTVR